LLSLDPDVDPMAAVLMVDFYALRAREYSWLLDLYQAWEPVRLEDILDTIWQVSDQKILRIRILNRSVTNYPRAQK
jgi:hypothetical protein